MMLSNLLKIKFLAVYTAKSPFSNLKDVISFKLESSNFKLLYTEGSYYAKTFQLFKTIERFFAQYLFIKLLLNLLIYF